MPAQLSKIRAGTEVRVSGCVLLSGNQILLSVQTTVWPLFVCCDIMKAKEVIMGNALGLFPICSS